MAGTLVRSDIKRTELTSGGKPVSTDGIPDASKNSNDCSANFSSNFSLKATFVSVNFFL